MKPSRNRYFIDESGQFAPRDGDIATMALLLVPDEPREMALVSRFAGDWRARFTTSGKLKARHIPTDEKLLLARTIVERQWFVAAEPVQLGEELDRDLKTVLREMVSEGRGKLDVLKRSDLRIDFLLNQVDQMTRDQCCWYMVLTKLLGRVCEVGEREGLCPVGTFFMDQKLPIAATELAGFLVRMGICTRFPAVFEKCLGLVLGVNDRDDWFDVRIATDDTEDGLVLADGCAAVLGQEAREGSAAPDEAKLFKQILATRSG